MRKLISKTMCGILMLLLLVTGCRNEQKLERLFDGVYHITDLTGNVAKITLVDGENHMFHYIDLGENVEYAAYGLEDVLQMPVKCSFLEFVRTWNEEKKYFIHFDGIDSDSYVVSIRELLDQRDCYDYFYGEEYGEAFYKLADKKGNSLRIVPYASDINTKEFRDVILLDKSRCYVLSPYYAERYSIDVLQEYIGTDVPCYIVMDELSILCIVVYDVI